MSYLGECEESEYKIGDKVVQRVNDPDGNEHKIVFIKTEYGWEIE